MRWDRRRCGAFSSPGAGARPGAAAAISAGAPGPFLRDPGLRGTHSFGSSFLPPLPSTRTSARVLAVPSRPRTLPPPVTFGSPGSSHHHHPPPRVEFAPYPQLPPPFTPSGCLLSFALSRCWSLVHTPLSLGLLHASPGHPALPVTRLEVGAPIPSTCAARPSTLGAALTSHFAAFKVQILSPRVWS